MTLQQAQRTPGYYGRLIEPWTPESNEPLLFRMVEVLTDGSIMEETMGDPLPLCPSSDLHDDWQPMEASLMLCGPGGCPRRSGKLVATPARLWYQSGVFN